MITKEVVIDFFEDLKSKNEFDSNNKLLWGYFFLDKDYKKLEDYGNKLSREGYSVVDIFEGEKENEDDVQEYYLHIEKIEHHDVESLDKLNKHFYELAKKNNVEFYDGFDVGNVR